MKTSLATKLALAAALSDEYIGMSQFKSPLPPKEKTQGDLDRLARAEEKRLRKAQRNIKANQ